MKIDLVAINQIKPVSYNPRVDLQPGDKEYEKLKKSMEQFGYVEPLVWNKRSGNLVGGHQRFKVLCETDQRELLCSIVDLDDDKEKALNIALNKISGEWDMSLLKDLLQELDTGDFEIGLTGFDDEEIEDLVTQFHVDDIETITTKGELDLSEFDEDKFDCQCPKCGFHFNRKG